MKRINSMSEREKRMEEGMREGIYVANMGDGRASHIQCKSDYVLMNETCTNTLRWIKICTSK